MFIKQITALLLSLSLLSTLHAAPNSNKRPNGPAMYNGNSPSSTNSTQPRQRGTARGAPADTSTTTTVSDVSTTTDDTDESNNSSALGASDSSDSDISPFPEYDLITVSAATIADLVDISTQTSVSTPFPWSTLACTNDSDCEENIVYKFDCKETELPGCVWRGSVPSDDSLRMCVLVYNDTSDATMYMKITTESTGVEKYYEKINSEKTSSVWKKLGDQRMLWVWDQSTKNSHAVIWYVYIDSDYHCYDIDIPS